MKRLVVYGFCAAVLSACGGEDARNCTVTTTASGTTIRCPDGTESFIRNGKNGQDGKNGTSGAKLEAVYECRPSDDKAISLEEVGDLVKGLYPGPVDVYNYGDSWFVSCTVQQLYTRHDANNKLEILDFDTTTYTSWVNDNEAQADGFLLCTGNDVAYKYTLATQKALAALLSTVQSDNPITKDMVCTKRTLP